jgi:hypothetical protein
MRAWEQNLSRQLAGRMNIIYILAIRVNARTRPLPQAVKPTTKSLVLLFDCADR